MTERNIDQPKIMLPAIDLTAKLGQMIAKARLERDKLERQMFAYDCKIVAYQDAQDMIAREV